MNQISVSLGGVLATDGAVAGLNVTRKGKWAVWNKRGHRPQAFYRHRDSALAEAARLVRLNPEHKFHVIYFDVKVSV